MNEILSEIWNIWFFTAVIAFLTVYWVFQNKQWRRLLLLLLSLALIATVQPETAIALCAYCWLVFQVGKLLRRDNQRYKRIGIACISLVVVFLVFLKHLNVSVNQLLEQGGLSFTIVVPLGISYFSFRAIHYLIECGRGTLPPHTFASFLLYLVFIPTFPSGPIERFEAFQAAEPGAFRADVFVDGLRRVLFGLAKKLLVADLLLRQTLGGLPLEDLAQQENSIDLLLVWKRLILYYLYCYFDFAALTDLAIGIGLLLGFRICENFNWPILARDLGDFWQRWHMSLANFCRYYIFLYVLSYTRRYYLGFLCTMLAIGLWHGISLNWAIWGAYHATGLYLFLFVRNHLSTKARIIYDSPLLVVPRILVTFCFVALGYVWVGTSTPYQALRLLKAAFSISN